MPLQYKNFFEKITFKRLKKQKTKVESSKYSLLNFMQIMFIYEADIEKVRKIYDNINI